MIENKFKVLINQVEEVELNKYDLCDIDNNNLNYNVLNNNRPIAYHNFCYNSQKLEYKSIDKNNSKDNKTTIFNDNPYLYSNNLKFVHEKYNEMCYICSSELEPSVLMWSWEFDRQIEINELFINLIFMVLEEESEINWYLTTSLSNEIQSEMKIEENSNVIKLVREQFTKIPLNLVSPVYFDKKINLTNIARGANKIFLACILDTAEDTHKNQLFRSKYQYDFTKEDVEPLHRPQKNESPFDVFFNLSLKSDLSTPPVQINNDSKYFIREESEVDYDPNIKKNQAINWSKQRVEDWLFDLGFYELIQLFKVKNIDGNALLEKGISILPNNFVQDLKKRKRYIKSLNQLLQNSNKSKISFGCEDLGNGLDCSNTQMQRYSNQYKEDTILIMESDDRVEQEYQNNLKSVNLMTLVLDDKENSNHKIIVDGEEFLIHREMLSHSSDYFNAIFNSSFNENINNETVFQEEEHFTKDSLKMVLELTYLHSDDMKVDYLKQLDWYQLKSILKVSDRLFFDNLKFIIENYIIWKINSKNLNHLNQIFRFNNNISLFSSFLIKFYNNNKIISK